MGTLPVFVMEIIFIECSNELFVLFLHSLQINLVSSLLVRIEIVREKHTSFIETFHFATTKSKHENKSKKKNQQNRQMLTQLCFDCNNARIADFGAKLCH